MSNSSIVLNIKFKLVGVIVILVISTDLIFSNKAIGFDMTCLAIMYNGTPPRSGANTSATLSASTSREERQATGLS